MKKRKNIYVLIGLIVLIGIILFLTLKENQKINYKTILKIKVGDDIPGISDYVNKDSIKYLENDKIDWQDINIESNKVYYSGKYMGYITVKNKKIELTLEVIDDVKPTIDGVSDITIYEGETVDFLKNIKATDNSKDEVSIDVSGEYDTKTKGEYTLTYVATDKSGNSTTSDFKLIVKEKVNSNSSVIGKTTKGYTIKKVNNIYYVNGILIANKTYNLPSSYAPGGLLDQFMNAFYTMQKDALKDGVNLSIISGYRSFSSQDSIYNRYVQRDGKKLADTYSARAGYSEHQTGLAADINSLDQDFINTKEGAWLNNNCQKFGFIIRYPKNKENITGYMYEPWHIRYVGVDIASELYNNGSWISLEEYLGITSKYSD